MDELDTPLVSICCLAYNHVGFIRQCLDGFMMQKTSFLFEVLIHDDASTDGTADIIREYEQKYPHIIKPIYQNENQYSKGMKNTLVYQFPRAKGKYIAFCEGDDYWTDTYKLQKQVDFLESNPEYSLCCHRFKVYNVEDQQWEPEMKPYVALFKNNEIGFSFGFYDNLNNWITQVLTVMVRRDSVVLNDYSKYKYFKDVHLFYHVLARGKGYCMNFFGSVYNWHFGGVYSKITNKNAVVYDIIRDLYINNKWDKQLKHHFKYFFSNRLHEESFGYTLKPIALVKSSADYLWHGGNFRHWAINVLWIIRFQMRSKVRNMICK